MFLTDLIPGSNTLRESEEDESELSSLEQHEEEIINDEMHAELRVNLETLKEDSDDDCQSSQSGIKEEE